MAKPHPHGRPSLDTLIVSPDRDRDVTNLLPSTQEVKVLCLNMVKRDILPNQMPAGLNHLLIRFSKGDKLADAAITDVSSALVRHKNLRKNCPL